MRAKEVLHVILIALLDVLKRVAGLRPRRSPGDTQGNRMITVIAGLGNPGRQYRWTRHNLGFRVIDALAQAHNTNWKRSKRFQALVSRVEMSGRPILLVKPQTYMNESGRSLRALAAFYKYAPDQFAVLYDEVNLAVGQTKLSVRGSAGGHNGIISIIEQVGGGVVRFRMGIGPKYPPEITVKDFVLGKFTSNEHSTVNKKMAEYLSGINLLVDRGPVHAMNRINARKYRREPSVEGERLEGDDAKV